jgi:hypothetical protein
MSLSDFPKTSLIVGDLDHIPETGELLDGVLRIAPGRFSSNKNRPIAGKRGCGWQAGADSTFPGMSLPTSKSPR